MAERTSTMIARRISNYPSKSRLTIGLLTYGAEDPNSNPLWEGIHEVALAHGANLLCFPAKPLDSIQGI